MLNALRRRRARPRHMRPFRRTELLLRRHRLRHSALMLSNDLDAMTASPWALADGPSLLRASMMQTTRGAPGVGMGGVATKALVVPELATAAMSFAAAGAMPMPSPEMPSDGAASDAAEGGGGGASGRSNGSPTGGAPKLASTRLSSAFVATPLFTVLTSGTDGKGVATFKAPQSLGTFVVRCGSLLLFVVRLD
jgi:hypothetical protein